MATIFNNLPANSCGVCDYAETVQETHLLYLIKV